MSDETSNPAPVKAKKKLPFKPTALGRATVVKPLDASADNAKVNDDGLELFRRSREMEPIVAADRERRLRKKQKEEERRRSGESAKRPHEYDEDDDASHEEADSQMRLHAGRADTPPTGGSEDKTSELVTPPASKRTRLDSTPSKRSARISDEADSLLDASPSTRLLRSTTKTDAPAIVRSEEEEEVYAPNGAAIVSLDSDSDGDDEIQIVPAVSARQRSNSIEFLAEDSATAAEEDEFAEYVRRAEDQRAKDQAILSGSKGASLAKERVEILVTSEIPGTKPCLMIFLFDKSLRVVRDSWLALQHKKGVKLPMDMDDEVVLTWRRKKVYSFSTLLSLGIRPSGNGRVEVDGHSSQGLRENRTKVHMEAWTPSLFQEMEREEEMRRKRDAGELSEEEDAVVVDDDTPALEIKIRVILRARDMEEVKLTVRPETTVETLVTGFRTQRGIDADKDVGLWFDGERLEEHVTMDEAEIDDMDAFEVHIK